MLIAGRAHRPGAPGGGFRRRCLDAGLAVSPVYEMAFMRDRSAPPLNRF
jgi:hypothetical protein